MLISTNTFTVIYVVYKITSNNNIYIYKLWGKKHYKKSYCKVLSVQELVQMDFQYWLNNCIVLIVLLQFLSYSQQIHPTYCIVSLAIINVITSALTGTSTNVEKSLW